mmetsp:Transcript_24180/g.57640  ORF Transcript_24180/g.57640 Transcript_24180/m.57640 type:complete len:235 (-) Transcript_24180:122-826(-)
MQCALLFFQRQFISTEKKPVVPSCRKHCSSSVTWLTSPDRSFETAWSVVCISGGVVSEKSVRPMNLWRCAEPYPSIDANAGFTSRIVPSTPAYAIPMLASMKPERYATSMSSPEELTSDRSTEAVPSAVSPDARDTRKSMAHWSTVFMVRLVEFASSVLGRRSWRSASNSLVFSRRFCSTTLCFSLRSGTSPLLRDLFAPGSSSESPPLPSESTSCLTFCWPRICWRRAISCWY